MSDKRKIELTNEISPYGRMVVHKNSLRIEKTFISTIIDFHNKEETSQKKKNMIPND